MGKNLKLDLKDLKVQSFVTDLEDEEKAKVKGGLPWTCVTCNFYCSGSRYVYCESEIIGC